MRAIRYALRSLSRSPGFAAIAILALGLGLGLSTTMFGVLDAVVHPYSPYREPDNLLWAQWRFFRRSPMSDAELYRFVRNETRAFEAVTPFMWETSTIEQDGEPQSISLMRVTPQHFSLTGIAPILGRPFTESDEDDVVLLSHGLWKRMFGSRRTVDGVTVKIGDRLLSVVGVLPEGAGDDAWLHLKEPLERSGGPLRNIRPFMRLRRGISIEQAAAELRTLADVLTERFDARDAPFNFDVRPLVFRKEEVKGIHQAMLGSALAVLAIACINLAHLMLARGLAKRRDLALRMALGASRGAIVRQMFAEAAIITIGGAALGALIASWGAHVLPAVMPREVSWIGVVRPQLSWRVFSIAAAAAAAASILFGLAPALRVAFDLNLDEPLKSGAGTTTGRVRYRYNPLVVAEVALTLALMVGGALLLRTVQVLQRERPDYNADTLWSVILRTRSATDTAVSLRIRRQQQIVATLQGVPGVRDVALLTSEAPQGGAVSAELTADSNRTVIISRYAIVSNSYMPMLNMPIVSGRGFEIGDAMGPGVVVVDEVAARLLYPNQQAVGRMLKLGTPSSTAQFVRIVGVVRARRPQEGDERYAPPPLVFVSLGVDQPVRDVLVRTRVPDPRIGVRLITALGQRGDLVMPRVVPFDYVRRSNLASRRFLAGVFITMGGVALGLSALGIYGDLAYSVSRRMREFAVRIALGAAPRELGRTVLRDAFVMLLAGIGVGAFVVLLTSRTLDSLLIAVLPSDVASLLISEIILGTAGLAAALVPALRASRANPIEILRAN